MITRRPCGVVARLRLQNQFDVCARMIFAVFIYDVRSKGTTVVDPRLVATYFSSGMPRCMQLSNPRGACCTRARHTCAIPAASALGLSIPFSS